MIVAPLYFGLFSWERNGIFATVFLSGAAVAAIVIFYYALANITRCRDFVCRIDDRTIECSVPLPSAGESFRLAIDDIVKVEKRASGESHDWYIWDAAGKQYQLTRNYGNPVKKFIGAILERNPAVVEEHTASMSSQSKIIQKS
jgi:hypothetical protein